uniref:Putative ovule protein n=1 Tax=Solanum chacoense TaxID=4108 RepID=A0A0V0HQ57_SOLCH
MRVSRVQNSHGQWLENEDDIANEAVNHFQSQFHQDRDEKNITLLEHIPELITEEENAELGVVPDEDEVKNAVYKLNGDSSSGPDGLTGIRIKLVRVLDLGNELPA